MEEEYWNNIMVGDTHSNDSQQFFGRLSALEYGKTGCNMQHHSTTFKMALRTPLSFFMLYEDRRREAMQKVKGHAQFQPLANDPFDDITAANQQRPGQPTMGSKELMSLLEPVTQKRREAAAAADTGNKENESEKLLRMVEQRIGACTIKDERKPSSTQASAAAAANVQPSKRAAASGATTTTTAKATRSADTSPRVFKVPPAVKRTASAASVRPLSAAAAGPSTAVAVVPNAYRYKAIYEQKLQRKTERLLEEERQARRVVARPMPNFEQAHRQLEHKQSNRPLTCPNTPKTLKYSLQSAERMKQRVRQQVIERRRVVK